MNFEEWAKKNSLHPKLEKNRQLLEQHAAQKAEVSFKPVHSAITPFSYIAKGIIALKGSKGGAVMFTFHNLDDLDVERNCWLIKNILPTGSICMLSGESEDLNALIATYFSLHVSSGHKWLSSNVKKKPVVYICHKRRNDIVKYTRDWVNNNSKISGDFRLSTNLTHCSSLNAEKIAAYVIHSIRLKGQKNAPALIVIDLKAMSLDITNSQNAKAILEFTRILQQECRATILLVNNENSIKKRGGYHLVLNHIDVAMRVEPLGDDCIICFNKMRDHQLPAPVLVKNHSAHNLGGK